MKDAETVLTLFRDMARALHHLHSRQIAHLNVHPESIFLDPAGKFVLDAFHHADLCNAKYKGDKYFLVPFKGRIGYAILADPYGGEQYKSFQRTSIRHSDIWSLGAVMYELMTGELPYSVQRSPEESSMEHADRLLAAMTTKPPSVQAIQDTFGSECATLVGRMLSCAEDDRPTAADILASQCLQNIDEDRVRANLRRLTANPNNRLTASSPNQLNNPNNRGSVEKVLLSHKNHFIDAVKAHRIIEGCIETVSTICLNHSEPVRLASFLHDPSRFFDDPRFSLVRSLQGWKALEQPPGLQYLTKTPLSFLIARDRKDGNDVLLEIERPTHPGMLAAKANELAVLYRLGLLRAPPFVYHYVNLAVMRRDFFEWTLPKVLQKARLQPHHRDSLIVDLIDEVARINRMGVVLMHLRTDKLAIRPNGSLGVFNYKGAVILSDEDRFGLPRTGNLCVETNGFCAPERVYASLHADDHRERFDPKMDAWSVGVIAYEIATGERLPFVTDEEDVSVSVDNQDLSDCYARLTTANMMDLFSNLDGKVSPFIAGIINQLLQTDPEKRLGLTDINLAGRSIKARTSIASGIRNTEAEQRRSVRHKQVRSVIPAVDASFINMAEQVARHFPFEPDKPGKLITTFQESYLPLLAKQLHVFGEERH